MHAIGWATIITYREYRHNRVDTTRVGGEEMDDYQNTRVKQVGRKWRHIYIYGEIATISNAQ